MTLCLFDRIKTSARVAKKLLGGTKRRPPRVGLILGSGLGSFVETIEDAVSVNYSQIPYFPRSTAPGHAGKLWVGDVGGTEIVAMQGRHHYYEGNTPEQCVHGVRTMIRMGATTIIVTNAAGTIDPNVRPSDLRIITGHINKTGMSPLHGSNDTRLGARFQPMNDAYDPALRRHALAVWDTFWTAATRGITLHDHGIYVMMPGPEYETAEEIEMLRRSGANSVGMSTVFEVIAARHMGARVFGVSCLTNLAAGVEGSVPSESEVLDAAAHASPTFVPFMREFIRTLPLTST